MPMKAGPQQQLLPPLGRNSAHNTQVAAICILKEGKAQKNNQEEKLACDNKIASACMKDFSP